MLHECCLSAVWPIYVHLQNNLVYTGATIWLALLDPSELSIIIKSPPLSSVCLHTSGLCQSPCVDLVDFVVAHTYGRHCFHDCRVSELCSSSWKKGLGRLSTLLEQIASMFGCESFAKCMPVTDSVCKPFHHWIYVAVLSPVH